ncbi:MAG: sigma-70 family RNA polymerase sigma factor [Chloroflexi bacterium]|nr:sigma-70 family RNA polymerase sigma factor [Chloroflexota bacterium]MCL5074763.1 sigma-70 family RNA polymerase sigma factor [Chloroflexota bacterium]
MRGTLTGLARERTFPVTLSEPDEILVERAKQDITVFGLLYQRHLHRIYNYVFYRTGNVNDAEDLTAKTFFQALSHLGGYQVRNVPFSAWLFRIAHNLVANWHRDRHRHQTVPLEEMGRPGRVAEETSTLEEQEQRLAIRAAMAKLPLEHQQLLILKFAERMSNAEIATTMGRSEGAVKAMLHRTLLSLRKELSRHEKDKIR